MDSWCKKTPAPVRDVHPDTVPTEYDTLKNIEEIEMILLEYNEEYLNLTEKWNNLHKYHAESLRMETKVKTYKELLLGERLEIEREQNEVLFEARKKTEDKVKIDQYNDILDLNYALHRLANRDKPDEESRKTCLFKICEIDTFSVETSSGKIGFPQDPIEDVRDFRLLIGSTQTNGFAPFAAEGQEDASREMSVSTKGKELETGKQEVKEASIFKNTPRNEKNEDEKFKKPKREFSKHLRETEEVIEQNCKDTNRNFECSVAANEIRASIVRNCSALKPKLFEAKMKPSTERKIGEEEQIEMNSYSSESLSSDSDCSTENVPGPGTIEHIPDEVQLANELKIAIIEHEQAREKVIKETVNKLKKLRQEEMYMTKKLNIYMRDYLSIYQENNEAAIAILEKNITGIKSKLNVIDCHVKFNKMESDRKIARIKLNFELRAFAERLQLAEAVKLLAQLRENQINL